MAVGTGVSVGGGSVAVGCSVADGCSVAVLVDDSVGTAFGALVAVALATTATTGGMIAGLAVRRLEPSRASLEERFLEITSRLEEAA